MHTLGLVVVVLAAVPLAYAWAQHRRGARLASAPFLRTGDVAESAHADVSFEGAIRPIQPFAAPCSGEPCVYVEIDVVREWTRSVATPTGARIENGRDVLRSYRTGAAFIVDDGSGPALVNPTEGLDAPLEQTFAQTRPMTDGTMWFGRLRVDVPPAPDGAHVVCVKAVERIFRATGDVFVTGGLAEGLVARRAKGTLRAARTTRAAQLGEATRHAGASVLLALALAVPGAALAAVEEAPPSDAHPSVRASDAGEVAELVGEATPASRLPATIAHPPATTTPPPSKAAALPKLRAKKRRAAR